MLQMVLINTKVKFGEEILQHNTSLGPSIIVLYKVFSFF